MGFEEATVFGWCGPGKHSAAELNEERVGQAFEHVVAEAGLDRIQKEELPGPYVAMGMKEEREKKDQQKENQFFFFNMTKEK